MDNAGGRRRERTGSKHSALEDQALDQIAKESHLDYNKCNPDEVVFSLSHQVHN
ncbi:hypothetical protein J6590_101659 [Homalodisca vitripennis]|nr:hypothetical protein J6590_101659 [Homalodisca vitripennis]